jgi:hypothetical protein
MTIRPARLRDRNTPRIASNASTGQDAMHAHDAASACRRRGGKRCARPPGPARLAVAGQLSPRWDRPSGSGRYAVIRWIFGALTPNIIFPSRRDNPKPARGGDKASSTSLNATLGCEDLPPNSLSINPSPNGAALIAGELFVELPSAFVVPFRAATLWLRLVVSEYPGRRQRSLRSRCLWAAIGTSLRD